MTETYKPGDKVLIVATVDAVNNDDPVQPIRVRIAGELANIWPRAEDIHGFAPPAHTGETVTVRALVTVADGGKFWTVGGAVGLAEDELLEASLQTAIEAAIGPCSFSWVTVDVPKPTKPTIPTITAKVEDGE